LSAQSTSKSRTIPCQVLQLKVFIAIRPSCCKPLGLGNVAAVSLDPNLPSPPIETLPTLLYSPNYGSTASYINICILIIPNALALSFVRAFFFSNRVSYPILTVSSKSTKAPSSGSYPLTPLFTSTCKFLTGFNHCPYAGVSHPLNLLPMTYVLRARSDLGLRFTPSLPAVEMGRLSMQSGSSLTIMKG
jgi:hypothetical protein